MQKQAAVYTVVYPLFGTQDQTPIISNKNIPFGPVWKPNLLTLKWVSLSDSGFIGSHV